jgi:hypothetical protein
MDTPRKVIVGYDLCDDFTQISCFSYKTMEPIPISLKEGEDYSPIPTALCVKTDTKQWLFGEEALGCPAGILVDHLLDKVRTEEEVELLGQKFTAISLLEKFLRKTLTLIKNYFPTEQITKLVVTVRNTEPAFVDKIYEALSLLGIEKDRASVISHAGAYLYYALSQDRTLWMNDVGMFDYNEEGLSYYQISLNRRSRPMIAGLKKIDYTEMMDYGMLTRKESNLAYTFGNIANTALYKQIVSTLYFTGSGFEDGWAEEVFQSLCVGRRVFYGQNLFTKGACYAAKEVSGDRKLNDIILLNDDMITSNLSIRVYRDTGFKEFPCIEAGETWYEVNQCIEVIPEGEAELEVIVKDILTKEAVRDVFKLDELPIRADRTSRLMINVTCKDKSNVILKVTDLGFGEFFPGTGKVVEFSIEI